MRNSCILLLITALSILSACGPVVTFDEPQPAGADNLKHFPVRLHGDYRSASGKSILTVSENLLIRTTDYDLVLHPSQLDSTEKVSGDTLINLTTNEKTAITFAGDSILFPIYSRDTLFAIGELNLLRKFKGHYFLNIHHEKSGWEVQELTLSKGALTLSEIGPEGFDKLKEIIEKPADTLPAFRITTDRKQFRDAINAGAFEKSEIYYKIKVGNRES